MLKHIVTWKMNGATAEQRAQQAAEIVAALEPLAETVPSVRSLVVYRNEVTGYDNWDVTLIAEFADADGLADYARHPEHLAAAAVIRERAAGRAGLDVTVP